MPIVEDDTFKQPETLEQLEEQRKRRIQERLLELNGPGETPEVEVKRAPPSKTMKAMSRTAKRLLRSRKRPSAS